MSIYDEWKKNNDSSVYTQWKKKKEEERKQYLTELSNNTNNTTSNNQTNNNLKIWKLNESTQSSQLSKTNNNQTNNAKDLLKKAEEYKKSDLTENVAQSNYVGNTENTIDNQYKNTKISQDILGIGENLARGASSGLKQTMNYATAVNKGYAGYNNITNQLARAKYLSTPIDQRNEDDLKKNFIEEAVNNSIAKDNEAISKNINAMSNKTTKKLAELAPSIGQMGTGTVIGSVNPILGGEYFFTSAAGSYLDDAKQRGMNDKQSIMYSTVMGGLEAITEEVGLRNFQKAGGAIKALASGTGKEGVKKAVQEFANKEIAKSVKDVLKNYGIGIADNFVQEAIMDPLQEISATAIAGKDKADWSNMGQKMLQDGINGGLVAAIVGGAKLGVNSCIGIFEKSSNGQTITQAEYNQGLQDAQKAGVDIQQNIKEKISEQFNNINKGTIQENVNSNNMQMEQNIERPKQVIKDFNESARQYNIDYSNEDLKEINQMYNKRGIKAYFDENTFKNNNDAFSVWKPVIDEEGNISGREVVINPNAEDTKTRVQELAVHELGHDLDLNEVQDMILKDASRKENWESARKSLENTYREAYKNDGINISEEEFNKIVDEEATMSILQRELGSQEYVNRLVNQNQSIAKKIYNWVIDKLNKFTGGKNEKIFWADIKNKFETAYNQEFNKNENNLKYSVIYNEDGSFNRVKIDDNIFENNEGKSINNTIKDYLEGHINEYANIIESGQKVYLGKDLPSEYAFSKSSQNLPLPNKLAKGRASSGLEEIIENASNRIYEKNQKTKHNTDAKYGFYKYDTKFSFEHKGKEQIYSGTVVIRNDADGKKYLYDITNIKKIGSNLLPVASNSKTSSAIIGSSNNSPTNSLPSTQQNVNSKPLQKYSMLESENNSGSFNLQENKPQYALPTKEWQQFVEDNYQKQGTGKNLKEYNLPTVQDAVKMNNNKQVELLTDEDYSVLNEIYEKEGRTEILTEKKKANILEKYANDKYKFKDSFDILAQKFVNKGHYIDKLSKEANNPELKFIYDKNLNSFAEGQYEIGVAQTNNEGKKIGKSINEIWEPVEKQNLTKEFSEYLLHKHNIDRSERNKYVFGSEIGPAESTAIAMELEKKHPEFKEYAKDIKKFNHNNLECLVDAGLLSNDMVNYLESMYPNYVTISRDLQDSIYAGDKDKTGVNAPLKKATGGNSDIKPLKDTMAQQAIKIKRLVNQNKLGQELAKTLKNAHVEQEGTIELSPTMLFELDTLVDTDTKGNKYYTYFENGELQKLKIDDNLYESLRPTERSRLEETMPIKALQKVTSMHRSVLTSSNPIFVVTNFFKDFQDGMFNSKYSSKFVKNYGKALNEIVTKGKYYESYMANGGMTNTYFDYNEGIKKKPNKFVEKIRSANEIVEQLPRLSEFISTLEDGKSLNEALYNAAEITTNFKRGGDITKALNRNGVNFLNASVQGLDKQFRNFSGQNGAKGYANLLVKATIMGIVPSILNHILLDDDDDYEKLPESTKDLYYLFKYDDGKFIRIPKGRVLSIFGAAARRTLETIEGQDDSWKDFKDTVVNQIAPNNPIEDNILAPIMQVKNNKTWYGSDLVSSRLQNELPKNQYDETTDEFSKWLGGKINVSPKKINYLIDQYSGGIGDVILPMITPQAKQNVLKDKFTTDSVLKNKYVSKFYDTLEKQTQIVNDPLSTDEDEIQLKYLNNTSKEMGDLYKEKRNIQMSKISNKEKTEKVREIQGKINELAENALQNYNNFSKNQNSAKIGDEEYYKNGKGEWKSLTDEAEQKNDNISTETYADYKQKIYNETQKQRNNGKLNKNQTLKQKDKIQILLNSKYSDKEKKAIYENYIKSEKDTEYKIMSCTNVDIDEYLKYKQQEFESDYKDDGTTTGKVITNSKKKKVYEYVNSSGMTYEQRLLLLGMQYKLNGQERTTLANYVNNLDITSTEKIKIYEKLEGFTVYKNGNIKW